MNSLLSASSLAPPNHTPTIVFGWVLWCSLMAALVYGVWWLVTRVWRRWPAST